MTLLAEAVQNPWETPAEWFTVLLAFLALVGSVSAILIARRSEKRQLFIPLHDRLTSAESQEGRRLLYTRLKTTDDIQQLFDEDPARFDIVNRTLGMYNTLGIYAHSGYIPKHVALDHWAGRVRNAWDDIERFLAWRRAKDNDPTKWSYLIWFAEESGAPVPYEMRLRPGWTDRMPPELRGEPSFRRIPRR